jgi:hypothetical protein
LWKIQLNNYRSGIKYLNHPSQMQAHLIHPLFQRGLKARKALFEKEGG